MRIFAGIIVWVAIISFIGCLAGVGYLAYAKKDNYTLDSTDYKTY